MGGAECLAQNRNTQDPKRRLSSRKDRVSSNDVCASGLGAGVLAGLQALSSEVTNSWDGCMVVVTILSSLFLQRLRDQMMICQK